MTTTSMIVMFVGILIGFICMVTAAGGFRAGWRKPVWISWTVAAFVFLTLVPVSQALTMGLQHG